MASQSIYEIHEAKLAPSEDGEPPIMAQYDTSTEPHVSPREALERHGDQEESQDSSPQDNPQPQDPNQGTTNVKGNLLGLSFPRKLWKIVEDDTVKSVHWNDDGDTLIIEENLFKREILCRRGEKKIFEFNSLKSFIRLLNLHGFSKIRPGDSSVCSRGNKMMIYQNCNFQRDKPGLLENIMRKGNRMTRALPGTSSTPTKRKKNMAPTRRSPRFRYKVRNNDAEEKAQSEAMNGLEPSAAEFFKYLGLRPTNRAVEVQCPSKAGGPSGEGKSGNVMFVPQATAVTDGTGDLPTSPQNDPLHGSVMSSYNVCYSTLMAGLSAMAPLEDPDKEEEEGSSNNKC
ncbi:heat shock transcription factor, X-linked member 3-like [Myotis daubentonii]|uniref:heat shock transcription factor, X-linked member 3-like n=1 Tax=Myotis daubentonii TaxID=98922 RepID=UPI00287319F9|nr:heat shock transcription factor, X-linked member 3-like [Myotis daubentonii]